MIRNEREYQEAAKRLEEERSRLAAYQAELETGGLAPDAVKRAMDPLRSFHLQLAEEVEYYEQLKRGDPGALHNLHGLGRYLIGLRIATGLTQRELAGRLGIDESQVSRDERNEYHGVSIERAVRILDALGVQLVSEVRQPLLGNESGSDLLTT
jgi:DNA-binding XRE family transcriptional regulator